MLIWDENFFILYRCYHGPLLYEAKCVKIKLDSSSNYSYFVHYQGWNKNWDEWVNDTRILKADAEHLELKLKLLKVKKFVESMSCLLAVFIYLCGKLVSEKSVQFRGKEIAFLYLNSKVWEWLPNKLPMRKKKESQRCKKLLSNQIALFSSKSATESQNFYQGNSTLPLIFILFFFVLIFTEIDYRI